jgi:hypothetical protein
MNTELAALLAKLAHLVMGENHRLRAERLAHIRRITENEHPWAATAFTQKSQIRIGLLQIALPCYEALSFPLYRKSLPEKLILGKPGWLRRLLRCFQLKTLFLEVRANENAMDLSVSLQDETASELGDSFASESSTSRSST